MVEHRLARIGLLVAPEDPYAAGYREALEHAGLAADLLPPDAADLVAHLDVLLLAGEGQANEVWRNAVAGLLRRGGAVVVSGGTWGLDALIGLKPADTARPRWIGRSRVVPPERPWPFWPKGRGPLPFYGAPAVLGDGAQVLATTEEGGVGIAYRALAGGHVLFFAPHVGQTHRYAALGVAVEADGVGPNDGSARLADGVCRAEDGTRLDFGSRRIPDGGGAPFFDDPFVDVVREVWVRGALWAALAAGVSPVLVAPWPESAPAAAFAAVEVEVPSDDEIRGLRHVLERFGVRTVWFTTPTGLPLETTRTFRKWGDEIGLLLTGDPAWNEERLRTQYLALHRALGVPVLHSVRAAGGRWRGLTAPYEMMEACGARVSVAKGGVQPGTQGFLFGTSHPFFLPRANGAPGPTMEAPTTLWLGPDGVADGVLQAAADRVVAAGGYLGVGVKAADAASSTVVAQVEALAQYLRSRGVRWMTPESVYLFERARRGLRRQVLGDGLQFVSDTAIEGATLLIAGAGRRLEAGGRMRPTAEVVRHGLEFTATHFDLEPKSRLEWRVGPPAQSEAA